MWCGVRDRMIDKLKREERREKREKRKEIEQRDEMTIHDCSLKDIFWNGDGYDDL
jgi:hypothetical protein